MKTIARPDIGKEEIEAVKEVMESGIIAHGEIVKKFEETFASLIGTKYAIATTNGTQALINAIWGLGIKKEVIVPSFTFIATATSVLERNAVPVFADVERKSFNLTSEKISEKITKNTEAIIPVHLYGNPCEMDEIMELAEEKELYVIEDCAQAHAASYKGKRVGSIGHIGCFSFYPTKNMTTGEGGIITTDNEELAEKIRTYNNHGQKQRYLHEQEGYNYRMTNIQAAIGLAQLKKLEKATERRRENADLYNKMLKDFVEIPEEKENSIHVYHQYTIKSSQRDKIIEKLKAKNIGYGIYYPLGLHQQPYLKPYANGSLSITEELVKQVVSLPVHPLVEKQEIKEIAEEIQSVFS